MADGLNSADIKIYQSGKSISESSLNVPLLSDLAFLGEKYKSNGFAIWVQETNETFIYDSTKTQINNGTTIINGFEVEPSTVGGVGGGTAGATPAQATAIANNTTAIANKVDKVAGKELVLTTDIAQITTNKADITANTALINALGADSHIVSANFNNTTNTLALTLKDGTVSNVVIPDDKVLLVNDLVTGGVNKALTAEQGKALKALIDTAQATQDTAITNKVDKVAGSSLVTTTDIAQITTNKTDLATNKTNITTNTADITTNKTNITTNTADIATNKTDIATNTALITPMGVNVATNATDIRSLQNKIVASSAISGTNLEIVFVDGTKVLADVTALINIPDVKLSSGVYNSVTKNIDFSMSNGDIVSVPVSDLIPVTTGDTLTGDGTALTPLKVKLDTDTDNILTESTNGLLAKSGGLVKKGTLSIDSLLGEGIYTSKVPSVTLPTATGSQDRYMIINDQGSSVLAPIGSIDMGQSVGSATIVVNNGLRQSYAPVSSGALSQVEVACRYNNGSNTVGEYVIKIYNGADITAPLLGTSEPISVPTFSTNNSIETFTFTTPIAYTGGSTYMLQIVGINGSNGKLEAYYTTANGVSFSDTQLFYNDVNAGASNRRMLAKLTSSALATMSVTDGTDTFLANAIGDVVYVVDYAVGKYGLVDKVAEDTTTEPEAVDITGLTTSTWQDIGDVKYGLTVFTFEYNSGGDIFVVPTAVGRNGTSGGQIAAFSFPNGSSSENSSSLYVRDTGSFPRNEYYLRVNSGGKFQVRRIAGVDNFKITVKSL